MSTIRIFQVLALAAVFAGCGKMRTQSGGPQEIDLKEAQKTSDTLLTNDEISYVLIYNPYIYDENKTYNEKLNTGEIGDYVEAVVSRADGVETPIPENVPFTTGTLGDDLLDKADLVGSRAGMFITPYRVGDMKNFYYGATQRRQATFTCYYAGQYCNVWGFDGTLSQMQANDFGNEFDRISIIR